MIAAVLAAAVAAGCGGDDQVRAGPEDLVPSKPDYISRADGICALYQGRIEQGAAARFGIDADDVRLAPSGEIVFKPGRRPPDRKIATFVRRKVVPELRAMVAELRALTPPTGAAGRTERIYDAAGRGIDRVASDPLVFADPDAFGRIAGGPDRLARRFGLRVCGLRSVAP